MTIWLSRHWRAEEIIAEAGRQLAIGGNIKGIVNASDRLYGEDLSALGPGALAALLALGAKGGGAVDELQLLERRNHILRRMFENGSLDEDELHRALAQPLRLRGSPGALLGN
jgi:membrane peptidoglycan carboxypeptidase